MTYDHAGLELLWTTAGGDAAQADTMAAIARAESGGDPSQVNSIDCRGLWQINPAAWPQYDQASLLNPAYNANAAVHVLAAQGLTAWEAYTNGTYKQYLTGAAPSSAATSTAATTSPLGQFVAVAQTSQNPLVLVNNWITNKSVNVLYKAFACCGVLILLAAIPQTSPYAGWAAACILFVLMIVQQPAAA